MNDLRAVDNRQRTVPDAVNELGRVSIIIKALNEERNIAQALKSALAALRDIGGEVIVVDSLSSDRTVDIAAEYPVRIVQFAQKRDCNCGAAVQLGYQHSAEDYIYVLDGDMTLIEHFLTDALRALLANASLAGVGGNLVDTRVNTIADRRRAERMFASGHGDQYVDDLGGGGLYRRAAIESVGYLGHRALAAYEEAELGDRLRARGWKLLRLARPAVLHTGHLETDTEMFVRLWRNGRAFAAGTHIRTSLGSEWLWLAIRRHWQVFAPPVLHITAIVAAIALCSLGSISWPGAFLGSEAATWGTAFATMCMRKKSVRSAVFSLISWHYFSVGAFIGACRRPTDPQQLIASQEVGQNSRVAAGGRQDGVQIISAGASGTASAAHRS